MRLLNRGKIILQHVMTVLVIAGLLTTVSGCFLYSPVQADSDSTMDLYISGTVDYDFANEIVVLVNKERKKVGLPLLLQGEEETESANLRARECQFRYSHRRPIPAEWTALMPSGYTSGGENLAVGYKTPESALAAWMRSPAHRNNILNDKFTTIGVGVFKYTNEITGEDRYTCTQHFSNLKPKDKVTLAGKDKNIFPVSVDMKTYPLKFEVFLGTNNTNNKLNLNLGQAASPLIKVKAEELWEWDSIFVQANTLEWKSKDNHVVDISKEGYIVTRGTGSTTVQAFTPDHEYVSTIGIIVKRSVAHIKMNHIDPQPFSNEPITPKVILTDGNKKLVEGKDFEVEYSDNIYVGSANINIKGKGAYHGQRTVYFSIYDQSTVKNDSFFTSLLKFFKLK